MPRYFKYHIGRDGPQIFISENGELPFRVEEVSMYDPSLEGVIRDVALDFGSGISGTGSNNIAGTINAADYSVFRAVHFNAFNIAGDLL